MNTRHDSGGRRSVGAARGPRTAATERGPPTRARGGLHVYFRLISDRAEGYEGVGAGTEGARPWPDEIRMSEEVRRLVDERWAEYGLGAAGAAEDGSADALRQLLRR